MNTPLQIGITGGIGSGKSIICRIFRILGASVYDADTHAKDLMTSDPLLSQQIRKEFGDDAYFPSGALNRQYLSDTVFISPDKIEILNNLVHPRVAIDYDHWKCMHLSERYVVREAAVLFESGSNKTLDKIITVSAPEDLRIRRVIQRDPHRDQANIQNIINNQMSEEERIRRADFVIVNDESTLVVPQVILLHQMFST